MCKNREGRGRDPSSALLAIGWSRSGAAQRQPLVSKAPYVSGCCLSWGLVSRIAAPKPTATPISTARIKIPYRFQSVAHRGECAGASPTSDGFGATDGSTRITGSTVGVGSASGVAVVLTSGMVPSTDVAVRGTGGCVSPEEVAVGDATTGIARVAVTRGVLVGCGAAGVDGVAVATSGVGDGERRVGARVGAGRVAVGESVDVAVGHGVTVAVAGTGVTVSTITVGVFVGATGVGVSVGTMITGVPVGGIDGGVSVGTMITGVPVGGIDVGVSVGTMMTGVPVVCKSSVVPAECACATGTVV